MIKYTRPALLSFVALAFAGCACPSSYDPPAKAAAPEHVERYCWVTGLKPEKAARYRELHAAVWPGVVAKIHECHIRDFSIHEREIDGKTYLIAYLEYTGDNFAADMDRMAADPETQRWWKETDPCQSPLPDADAKGKVWSDTKELMYLP